jgi:hypothetical protein
MVYLEQKGQVLYGSSPKGEEKEVRVKLPPKGLERFSDNR